MSERLSDLDHIDALGTLRDRVAGLECAVNGLRETSGDEAFRGVTQLADDVSRDARRVYAAFDAERHLRQAEGGARG